MIGKGQIIEIPSTSVIYAEDKHVFSSKKDEFIEKLQKRNYDLFDGFLVGEHPGVEYFKLGQRKGINVGGKNAPLYVIGVNNATNQLFVGEGEKHPGLSTKIIQFDKDQDLNLSDKIVNEGVDVTIQSSLIEKETPAKLYVFEGKLFLEFEISVSIAIQNHPLEIHFNNNHTTTIKIN